MYSDSRSSLPTKSNPAPVIREPLFRPEVMVECQSQWLGTVLLQPRISHWVFATIGLVAAAAVLGMLFFASFPRKVRMAGWLVPQHGLVRVFAPQPGVITQLHVREGQPVRMGEPLVVISTELHSEAMGATRQEVIRKLVKRRSILMNEKALQEQLFDQQRAELTQRLAALRIEQQHLESEMRLQQARIQLSEKVFERMRLIRGRDLIPEPRVEDAQREQIDQAARMQVLERSMASLKREQVTTNATLEALPLRRQTQIGEVERNVAALEQDLVEAEARRETVIRAPHDGTVTAIQTELGGNANTTVPLLSIVPSDTTLQAQLFSPSQGIGFMRPGQKVLLSYAAFPYQKFGFYQGVVASISRSAVSPSELTQHLAGLTSLYGANEPVYRITVDLAKQTAIAYGEAVPLQPGMQLTADILIERRLLIEWVLDPLYTLSGKWHG